MHHFSLPSQLKLDRGSWHETALSAVASCPRATSHRLLQGNACPKHHPRLVTHRDRQLVMCTKVLHHNWLTWSHAFWDLYIQVSVGRLCLATLPANLCKDHCQKGVVILT